MLIRKFIKKDAEDVCKIISHAFNTFVASGFTKKAVEQYLKKLVPEEQVEKAKTREVYVAVIDNRVVGMIEGKIEKIGGRNRVSKLFVDKEYHGKGVGKKLMNKIEIIYKKRGLKKIFVCSSLHARGFYEKIGYKKTTGLINKKGMVYQPMKKIIN